MRTLARLLFTVFFGGSLIACLSGTALAQQPAPSASKTSDLSKFFADYFDEVLRDNPEFATNVGRHEFDDRWTDLSPRGREIRREHLQQRLQQLDKYPLSEQSDEDQLSIKLLRYDLATQLEAFDLDVYLLRVGQLFGAHNRIYLTIDRMPSQTVRDCDNIIARLRAVPVYVDQNIAIMNEAIARGWTQPKIVADLVIEQLSTQVSQDTSNTALLEFLKKTPSSIAESDRARITQDATNAFNNDFRPAWRKWLAYMQATYLPKVRPQIALTSMPDGKKAYATLIRRLTTTSTTPEEIHRIGEQEIARIEAEMLAIARQTGFQGSVSELEAKLAADPQQRFHSKDEMLIYCRNVAKIVEPELPHQFKHIPLLLYGIRAIPADREKATASNAQAPTPDGSTPGWFNLQAYEPEKQVRYDKEALVLHEAVPGHIFQGTLARSLQGLPEFRRFYGNSAYAEGWALYVESLGDQLGVYRDPYNKFGQLASERFRAARLVIDTGIHSMGWTREQAQDYLREHAPAVSLAEIDRYISWPAQALSYKMGQLTIVELRRKAEQRLGPRFDVRDFHDVVLRDGSLPLELLEQQVQKYIQSGQ